MVTIVACGEARVYVIRAFGKVYTFRNSVAKRYFG